MYVQYVSCMMRLVKILYFFIDILFSNVVIFKSNEAGLLQLFVAFITDWLTLCIFKESSFVSQSLGKSLIYIFSDKIIMCEVIIKHLRTTENSHSRE